MKTTLLLQYFILCLCCLQGVKIDRSDRSIGQDEEIYASMIKSSLPQKG
jgi:hypothetical protein